MLNLGLYGYDIEYAVERFRVRGQKYDPDLIIWLIKDDDFFPQEFLKPRVEFYQSKFGTKSDSDNSVDAGRIAFNEMKEEFEKEEMIQYEAKSLYLMNNFYKKCL